LNSPERGVSFARKKDNTTIDFSAKPEATKTNKA
jgi:hypothetical protein